MGQLQGELCNGSVHGHTLVASHPVADPGVLSSGSKTFSVRVYGHTEGSVVCTVTIANYVLGECWGV